MIYVVRRVFWWLCDVDECGFGCLIVVLSVVPKFGLVCVSMYGGCLVGKEIVFSGRC